MNHSAAVALSSPSEHGTEAWQSIPAAAGLFEVDKPH